MFKLIFITILSIITIQGCSKKEIAKSTVILLNDTIPCYNPFLDTTPVAPGYVRLERDIRPDAAVDATYPVFNPINNNQFIYVRDENQQASLVKFDLSTRRSEILYSCPLTIYDIRWSTDNEIAFVLQQTQQVYIIKSDGTNLKQITHSYFYSGAPVWYKNNSEILVRENARLLLKYDKEGNKLDTIPLDGIHGYHAQDADNQDNIVISDPPNITNQFAIINPDNTIRYYTFSIPQSSDTLAAYYNSRATDIRFKPVNNNEVFFLTLYGIYKYDLLSTTTALIHASCGSKLIEHFSISGDGQKIIASVDIRLIQPNNKVGDHRILYIMNIDGSDERIINLP